MILTIAICSYNRSYLLKKAIDSLIEQYDENNPIDVFVVDNNSTDDTKDLVKSLALNNSFIKYFNELQPGISYARNRAIKECKSTYLGFIDDDAMADKNFIENAMSIIKLHSPEIFGGPIYPYYLNEKPEWFNDKYEIRLHNQKTGWTKKSTLSASNLFIKTSLFTDVGMFDVKFGPKGNILNFGEETDFLLRANKLDKSFYYDLDLKVLHLVPPHKMHTLYCLLSNYQMGKSNERIKGASEDANLKALLDYMDHFFKELNIVLTTDFKNTEKQIIERLAYDFNKIGQISQKLQSALQNEKGLSIEEIIELNRRENKKISIINYLRGVLSLTKKLITSYK